MKNFSKGWYVMLVRSKQEKKVHSKLFNADLNSFLPLIKMKRKWSDRHKIIEVPLIPSYVFIEINNYKEYCRALAIEGTCGFLKFGTKNAMVTNSEIAHLKQFLAIENLQDVKIVNANFEVGQKVKIKTGIFAGVDCEVFQIESQKTIKVRIDSLRQNIIATLPAHTFVDAVA